MQAIQPKLVQMLQDIISPHYNHWVLFENDTFIVFSEQPEDIKDRALEIIRYYGCQRQGGTISDFKPSALDKEPGGWLVPCYYQGVFTYVAPTEVEQQSPIETAVSFKGREKRKKDGEKPVIVHIQTK